MRASDVLNIIEELVNGVSWSKSKDRDTALIGSLVVNWKNSDRIMEFWVGNSALVIECANERTAKGLVSEYFPLFSRVSTFSQLDSALSGVCSDPALVKRWVYVGTTG